MTDVDAVNFFRDDEMIADPYPYYEALRSECPVRREPHENVVMITGYEEATAVFNDTTTFSSCTSVTGPFPGFPVPLDEYADGDISELILEAPRRAADERPAPDARSADAHRPSRSADAADHAEAPEGERGVHVAVGRPPDSTRSSTGAAASSSASSPARSRCSSSPTSSACRRRTTSGSRRRCSIARRAAASARTRPADGPFARSSTSTSEFTTYIEDRRSNTARGRVDRAGHRHVPRRLDARGDRRRARGGQPVRRRPGDDRPPARLRGAADRRGSRRSNSSCVNDRDLIPNFIEESLRTESPIKGDFRLSRGPTHGGRRRHSRPARR